MTFFHTQRIVELGYINKWSSKLLCCRRQ